MAPVEVDKVTGKLMNNACATKRMKKNDKSSDKSHSITNAMRQICKKF
jgi:hypothetical protein